MTYPVEASYSVEGLGTLLKVQHRDTTKHLLTHRGKTYLVGLAILIALGLTFALVATQSPEAFHFLCQNHRLIYMTSLAFGGTLLATLLIGKDSPYREALIHAGLYHQTIQPKEVIEHSSKDLYEKIQTRARITVTDKYYNDRNLKIAALLVLAVAIIATPAILETHFQLGAFLLHENRFIYPVMGLLLTLLNQKIKMGISPQNRLKYLIISQLAIFAMCALSAFLLTTPIGGKALKAAYSASDAYMKPLDIALTCLGGLTCVYVMYRMIKGARATWLEQKKEEMKKKIALAVAEGWVAKQEMESKSIEEQMALTKTRMLELSHLPQETPLDQVFLKLKADRARTYATAQGWTLPEPLTGSSSEQTIEAVDRLQKEAQERLAIAHEINEWVVAGLVSAEQVRDRNLQEQIQVIQASDHWDEEQLSEIELVLPFPQSGALMRARHNTQQTPDQILVERAHGDFGWIKPGSTASLVQCQEIASRLGIGTNAIRYIQRLTIGNQLDWPLELEESNLSQELLGIVTEATEILLRTRFNARKAVVLSDAEEVLIERAHGDLGWIKPGHQASLALCQNIATRLGVNVTSLENFRPVEIELQLESPLSLEESNLTPELIEAVTETTLVSLLNRSSSRLEQQIN